LSWDWITGNSAGVLTGSGTKDISIYVENLDPAVTYRFYAGLKLVGTDNTLKYYVYDNVKCNPNIRDNLPVRTAATSSTIDKVKTVLPAVVPKTGVVPITVSYTAAQNSIVLANFQQYGGDWTWYAGSLQLVPQGTGSVTINVPVVDLPIGLDPPIAIQATIMNMEDYPKDSFWDYYIDDKWTPTVVSSTVAAVDTQGTTYTSDSTSSGMPDWGYVVVGISVGIIVTVIGIVLFLKLSKDRIYVAI